MSPPEFAPVETSQVAASVEHLPVNLFASVMGLAGLALAWRLVRAQFGFAAPIAWAISWLSIAAFIAIAMGYLIKVLRHPEAVRAEFAHPIVGSFFGTISISLLMLSAVIEPYSGLIGRAIWIVGCVVTLTLAYVVLGRLLRGKADAAHAVPAWLIPGVATLDIAVTGAHMPMAWAGQLVMFAVSIGAVLALVMFTVIGTRLIQHAPLSSAMTPSLMILVAPFEVGFLAYVQVVGEVDRFAALLFYFGLFMFLIVAPKVFRPGARFGSTWWAIGFPMAALVNAALEYAAVHPTLPLRILAASLLILLSVALGVLAVRTLQWLWDGRLLAGMA